MDYITAEELKYTTEMTGFNFADGDIPRAISATSKAIEEYCGVASFSTIADTRYFTPTAPYYLNVDDLVSVSTFAVDNDGDGAFEISWSYPRDYVLEPLNAPAWGKPYDTVRVQWTGSKRFPYWPTHRSVQVIGTFGWPAVPDPVRQAALIMTSRLLRRAREAPFGVVGLGIDNVGVRINRTVDSDICFLLDPFISGGGIMVA